MLLGGQSPSSYYQIASGDVRIAAVGIAEASIRILVRSQPLTTVENGCFYQPVLSRRTRAVLRNMTNALMAVAVDSEEVESRPVQCPACCCSARDCRTIHQLRSKRSCQPLQAGFSTSIKLSTICVMPGSVLAATMIVIRSGLASIIGYLWKTCQVPHSMTIHPQPLKQFAGCGGGQPARPCC